MEPEPVGLYVHVPFCRRKCDYCDFVSYTGMEDVWPAYLEAVVGEIVSMAPLRPRTLYVGGGTPTIWPAEYLVSLVCAARVVGLEANAEATVEANPGTVNGEMLARLREAGYNRLSIGVQSTVEANLRLLGRIHTYADAVAAVGGARSAGFTNVSIDLIYGLPGQSPRAWEDDLRRALGLCPEHLSAYGLSLEEGTPLTKAVACRALPEPDSDAVADMYEITENVLAEAGFAHYEISNWARPSPPAPLPSHGRGESDEAKLRGIPSPAAAGEDRVRVRTQEVLLTCEHNLIYWRNEPYLGLGAGAHSYLGGRRFARVGDPRDYVRATPAARVAFSETLDRPLEMAETAILALRLVAGLSRSCFEDRFGVDPLVLYGDVFHQVAQWGLVEMAGDRISLTRRGRLLSNEVFQLLLPD
ncbi:MAG: coproporphyrinogen-III oxidase family protein [Anaerolineae bacterium]